MYWWVYIVMLVSFLFLNHPVYYCMVMIIISLVGVINLLVVLGSWYSVLILIIYISGVYVLFLFVAMHSPNINSYFDFNIKSVLFVVFVISFFYVSGYNMNSNFDYCLEICNAAEGIMYILMCTILLLAFVIVGLIGYNKTLFSR